jgi:lauroyl/myristoyl acyltransferase
MNHLEYIESRNSLLETFSSENLKITENENLNGQFSMVSAGLLNYLPSIAFEDHEKIFQTILLHKKLSTLEQASYHILDYVETENLSPDTMGLMKNKPTIICTFHTGSYRIINLFLIKNKIPYTLVMGKNVIEKEVGLFSELYDKLPGLDKEQKFRLIDAESSNSGLQMLREIKAGRSLLLYMDGNTGAGTSTTKNDNRCVVDFLHQQIFARKGISFLAHAANVPIITVACYRKSLDNICLKFFDPIHPDVSKDRSFFAEETTQYIYNLVTPIIREYPDQWEAWLYIHKVAKIINRDENPQEIQRLVNSSEKIVFNSPLFSILKLNEIPYLFRKNTYTFYQIDIPLYDNLIKCNSHPVDKECFEENLLDQLYGQGVVKYN